MIKLSDYNIELHLIRHGKYEPTKIGGWSDDHLSQDGIFEVEELLNQIDKDYDVFYSSDLNRAKDTALIINKKLNTNIVFDSNLREFDSGIFNLMTIEEYQKSKIKMSINSMDDRFPEGESFNMFFERINKEFVHILETNRDKKILMVTHGGVITCILCLLNDYEYNPSLNIGPKTGSILKLK